MTTIQALSYLTSDGSFLSMCLALAVPDAVWRSLRWRRLERNAALCGVPLGLHSQSQSLCLTSRTGHRHCALATDCTLR